MGPHTYLAGHAAKVWMLVRGPGLAGTMSRYLVERIHALPNVELLTDTTVTGTESRDGLMEALRWRTGNGPETRRAMRNLFLFIGADPNTEWLEGSGLKMGEKGFVLTGPDAARGRHPLETSRPGVFAIGDVRAGSVKRVAAAVGEGAQVVAAIHAHLAHPDAPGPPGR